MTREETIAQMFGSASALTPIGTPELTSNGVYSAPFYKVNTAQGLKYFTPAFGKENGREIQTGGGEGGAISYGWEGNGGYDIAPWNNWSNGTYWMPQTDGMQTVTAPWAADLVKGLPYQVGAEYTGGGWVSDTPPGYRTWQQTPDQSTLSMFMQGPMIPLAGFLGAGALAGLGAAGGAGAAAAGTGAAGAGAVGGALGAGAGLGAGALASQIGSAGITGGANAGLGALSGGAAAANNSGGGMWDSLDSLINGFGDSGAENLFGFEGGGGIGNAAQLGLDVGTSAIQGAGNPSLLSTIKALSDQLGISPSNAMKLLQNGNGSALSRLLSGNAGAGDYLSAGGNLASTLLGMYASNQQTNALKQLADRYAGYGAPYRDKLAASYADPAGFLANSPDIQASVDQGTNAMARSLSTTGNPVGSGNSLQQLQDYATKGLYGQLGNERNRLANFGGLSNFNAASPGFSSQAVASQGNAYNALGSGIASLTNQNPTLADLIKAMQGGGNIFGTP